MVYEFKFPDVGEGITEGVIVKWLIKKGDTVKEDQKICEIETDKAIVDIPCPKKGTITRLTHKVGDTINVGEILVIIDDGSDNKPKDKKPAKEKKAKKKKRYTGSVIGVVSDEVTIIPSETQTKKSTNSVSSKSVKATFKVRKLAKKLGVDLSNIKGSGPNGRIVEEDLKKTPSSPTSSTAKGKKIELKGLRKKISENMMKSHMNTVPVTNFYDVDVTNLWNIREKEKLVAKKKGVKLTLLSYVVKILVDTLENHPYINSSLDGNNIVLKDKYNIGIAVDTPEGLIVPNLKDANKKELYEIAKQIVDFATRAQNRKLKIDEIQNGTFTITNLGSIGVKYFTPVINYPESAILGMGKIEDKLSVDNENIVLKKVLPLSLTYDHRLIDGATASRFMKELIEKLNNYK
jgi:pyruvate dehydrogenase E2 component (dihydrolipoamide acetyltransferase)